jgi:FkbM family methyltransferase
MASRGTVVPALEPDPGDPAGWSLRTPPLLRFAKLWALHSPRAKGWLPKRIGLELALDPLNLDVFFDIVREGGHDLHVVRACLDLTGDGRVFYDVGANVGYVSLSLARAFPGTTVIAFEPQPGLATSLARSARLNGFGNISVVPAMVGARDGSAQLFLPGHPFHATAAPADRNTRSITTPMWTLDSLVASRAIPPPDVIKIDVEGGERDVFEGAESVIRQRQPVLVFEAIGEHTRRFGYAPAALLDLLSRYGEFEFRGIRDDGAFVRVEEALNDPNVHDFVAFPPGLVASWRVQGIGSKSSW